MKKPAIIALVTVAAALFLSQTVIKYNNIEKKCIHVNDRIEAYPYADAEIPDDFTDYTIHGISLKAPDCLVPKVPEGKTEADAVRYYSSDTGKCDVRIFVSPEDSEPVHPEWKAIGDDGFFKSRLTRKSIEKMGYDIPKNDYELNMLFGTMDINDCSRFSLSEVSAFRKLAVYKEIMFTAIIGIDDKDDKLEPPVDVEPHTYFYETDKSKLFITQTVSMGGRYQLSLNCYDVDAPDIYRQLVILSDDPVIAQEMAKTVCYAEG